MAGLPADLAVGVLVVLHVPPTGSSALPGILDRSGPLPVRHAVDGDRITPGQVLVAPPDHHLVVLDGHVGLTHGPQENGHRPAVDVLFRSAARAAGGHVLALVLPGTLDDGAAGAVAVVQRGGRCLVQDPDEALYDGMPRAAARAAALDASAAIRLADVPAAIATWLAELPPPTTTPVSPLMRMESAMADLDPDALHDPERPGSPAGFGCPDCAGSLFEIHEGNLHRYRCRVGHAWSPESLLARHAVGLESALWMALRSLEEKAALAGDMSGRAEADGRDRTAAQLAASAREARDAAELVRRLVAEIGDAAAAPVEPRADGGDR